jgi:hypothetical protein
LVEPQEADKSFNEQFHAFFYTSKMNTQIHIGELIRDKLKEDGHSISWFAEKISCDRTNIYKIFQSNHIHPVRLLQISHVLNYDFFVHYSEYLAENKKNVEILATEM